MNHFSIVPLPHKNAQMVMTCHNNIQLLRNRNSLCWTCAYVRSVSENVQIKRNYTYNAIACIAVGSPWGHSLQTPVFFSAQIDCQSKKCKVVKQNSGGFRGLCWKQEEKIRAATLTGSHHSNFLEAFSSCSAKNHCPASKAIPAIFGTSVRNNLLALSVRSVHFVDPQKGKTVTNTDRYGFIVLRYVRVCPSTPQKSKKCRE